MIVGGDLHLVHLRIARARARLARSPPPAVSSRWRPFVTHLCGVGASASVKFVPLPPPTTVDATQSEPGYATLADQPFGTRTVHTLRIQTDVCPTRATSGRNHPTLVDSGPTLIEFGTILVDSGTSVVDSGPILVGHRGNFARKSPHRGRFRARPIWPTWPNIANSIGPGTRSHSLCAKLRGNKASVLAWNRSNLARFLPNLARALPN